MVVACESGCGGALIVVHVWVVVVICAPAWALVVVCVWVAVVVQASMQVLVVCAACWGEVGHSSPSMGCAMGAHHHSYVCWCGCGVSCGICIVAGGYHLWEVVGLLLWAVMAC